MLLIERAEIPKYIPQRPPIVLVHGLCEYSENNAVSEFTVEEDHLFVRDGRLLWAGLLENMAQTAALHAGYAHGMLLAEGASVGKPPVGFIGAVKNLSVDCFPVVGSTLSTSVQIIHKVLGMQVVEASVMQQKIPVASCELKIFLSSVEGHGS